MPHNTVSYYVTEIQDRPVRVRVLSKRIRTHNCYRNQAHHRSEISLHCQVAKYQRITHLPSTFSHRMLVIMSRLQCSPYLILALKNDLDKGALSILLESVGSRQSQSYIFSNSIPTVQKRLA
jgi:hypothetical protein